MAGVAGQAAGLAVGAAVGSFFGPAGALAGASIGASAGGLAQSLSLTNTQQKIDTAALKLNQAQFHAKAAEQSNIHASNFRQSLAHQVSIATMRGGSGSLATQFGSQAYKTFLQDQKSIENGLAVSDAQTELTQSDINNRTEAAQTVAVGHALSAFDSVNLNAPRKKKGA